MPPRYEVRLTDDSGLLPPELGSGVSAHRNGAVLLLVGEMDQAALHGLLERARALQLPVLDVRRSRARPRRPS
jgi:hypothetical protein